MADEKSTILPIRASAARTVATPIPGVARWWDNLEKTELGWPLVICFDSKADRAALAAWLKSQ
jgi:hypothetical protein